MTEFCENDRSLEKAWLLSGTVALAGIVRVVSGLWVCDSAGQTASGGLKGGREVSEVFNDDIAQSLLVQGGGGVVDGVDGEAVLVKELAASARDGLAGKETRQ